MSYDISADYVDSTTTYEPRSTIIDSDYIGGHSKCRALPYSLLLPLTGSFAGSLKRKKKKSHKSAFVREYDTINASD
jgi:hypothetical protein